MKGITNPPNGIGMRKLFRKAGYQVYLVDEHRTSCRCYKCERRKKDSCETFRKVTNPRPWRRKERPFVTCHGLVKCKTCSGLWNRDVNSSLNILRIIQCRQANLPRPGYLQRTDDQVATPGSPRQNISISKKFSVML